MDLLEMDQPQAVSSATSFLGLGFRGFAGFEALFARLGIATSILNRTEIATLQTTGPSGLCI